MPFFVRVNASATLTSDDISCDALVRIAGAFRNRLKVFPASHFIEKRPETWAVTMTRRHIDDPSSPTVAHCG
jgi:hypothetical protein